MAVCSSESELWMWPNSRPTPYFTLLLQLYPDFLMISFMWTLKLNKSGLMITQKSPLWLAFSECGASLVWIEWWSWVGWGSGHFIVQISSWVSVIWTVCLASILCSSGPFIGQQFRQCFALLLNIYNFDLWLIQNPMQQANEENTGKRMGAGGCWALGFQPSRYIWGESFGSTLIWQKQKLIIYDLHLS